MSEDLRLNALHNDLDRITERIAGQIAKDPDHEVALAMFRADQKRAQDRLADYKARAPRRRTFIDGKQVACT